MKNYFIFIALIVAIGFVGYQIYGVTKNYRNLLIESRIAKSEAEALKQENMEIRAKIERLQEPENLVQEIKRQFNFRRPGERTIIVAPER